MKQISTLSDLFPVGTTVNAKPYEGDFANSFTGTVTGYRNGLIQVTDQDGDVFECELFQLSFNTDDIMHN